MTPQRFEQQITGLRDRGYRPIPLSMAVAAAAGRTALPARSFVITFDDGYENNYVYAAPILERLQAPATVFLATAYLDTSTPFPFEDWTPARTLEASPDYWRPMTWRQCRHWNDGNLVEFGSHTHSHRNCLGKPDDLRRELELSFAVLRERLGPTSAHFSFPFGAIDDELADVARASEADCALTSQERNVLPEDDPYLWGRYTVEREDDGRTLAAKLDGRYSLLCDQARRWTRFARRRCPVRTTQPQRTVDDSQARRVPGAEAELLA